jgi:filamentous hemagglutinin family protein
VRRLFSFLVGNWPLKIGAIALATILYGGVVISDNVRTWAGEVPIEVLNPPPNAAVLDVLGSVTNIRYRAPVEAASQLTNGSFRASVDLANVKAQPGGVTVDAAVNLFAIDQRVTIVDYNPIAVRVRIDLLKTSSLPVTVDYGVVPNGFRVGPPQITPKTVNVTGATSRVARIQTITARVTIDASGISVNQEAPLVALDEQGSEVPGLRIEPARVHVGITVARDLANATIPVIPAIIGPPAPGYEVKAVTVDPVAVGVGGESQAVAQLSRLDTEAIDLSGRTSSFAAQVAIVAPLGITINGQATVRVSVTIVVSTASRTFELGLEPTGGRADLLYDLSRPSVLVTLSGPAPAIDALDPATLHATLPVGALDVGTHLVTVTLVPPEGITASISPTSVEVVIRVVPRPSPSESPGASSLAPSTAP